MNKKSINYQHIMPIRDVWQNYKSEVVFGVILSMLVVFSYRVAAFIPEDFFGNVIAQRKQEAANTDYKPRIKELVRTVLERI